PHMGILPYELWGIVTSYCTLYDIAPSLSPFRTTLQQTLTDHRDYVIAVSFSPDGTYLATGSHDSTACVYTKDKNNHWTRQQTLTDHRDYVKAVSFSPDGNYLV